MSKIKHLRGVYLLRANLREANLREADLREADLRGADLRGAYLWGADLREADLRGADLQRADLQRADLWRADIQEADLLVADLRGANLWGADLRGADLRGTVLDPDAEPNGGVGEWEDAGDGWVYGYRTRISPVMGGDCYADGREYRAPWFSICATECHPGLYVEPTADAVRGHGDGEIVRVRLRRTDLHAAGGKHRCRAFVVLGAHDE